VKLSGSNVLTLVWNKLLQLNASVDRSDRLYVLRMYDRDAFSAGILVSGKVAGNTVGDGVADQATRVVLPSVTLRLRGYLLSLIAVAVKIIHRVNNTKRHKNRIAPIRGREIFELCKSKSTMAIIDGKG
jgi:hypothetical protein